MDKCKEKWPWMPETDNPVLQKDDKWFEEQLQKDNILFEDLYLGTWQTDKGNSCQGKVCYCTLGSKVIY